MYTVLDEPKLIQDYNTEYYRLINFYSNIRRTANFVKYYNLAMDDSPRKDITLETYDDYIKTQSKWDVYDLTPMQIIAAIQNTPDNNMDLKGQSIISATTIQLYTIDNPRIGDLVTFYKPAESEEVLRVMNVRLQLNSNYSTEPLKFYEVDLETAPIKYENVNQLLIHDHFVYDLTIERNVEYEYYKEYIQQMKKLELTLNEIDKYYLPQHDFYGVDGELNCELNELLYFIKSKFNNKYYRLFEKIKSPFGYWDHYDFKYTSINDILNSAAGRCFKIINYLDNTERDYILPKSCPCSQELSNLDNLLYKTLSLLSLATNISKYIDHSDNFHNKRFKPTKKIYQAGNNVVETEEFPINQ